jgi:hypothetical protein
MNNKNILLSIIFILVAITGCSNKTTQLPDSPCACLETDKQKSKGKIV